MEKTIDLSRVLTELRSDETDTREKAAHRLYVSGGAEKIPEQEGLAEAIRNSLLEGSLAPSAFLLAASHFGPDALPALEQVLERHGTEMTKFNPWDRPLQVSEALLLPMAKTGDLNARLKLLERLEDADVALLAFLLQVIDDIDSPEILNALARALDNEQPIGGGAPSGAGDPRRVCDAAVHAFVSRLDLPVTFALRPAQRYSDKEIAEVGSALSRTIPK